MRKTVQCIKFGFTFKQLFSLFLSFCFRRTCGKTTTQSTGTSGTRSGWRPERGRTSQCQQPAGPVVFARQCRQDSHNGQVSKRHPRVRARHCVSVCGSDQVPTRWARVRLVHWEGRETCMHAVLIRLHPIMAGCKQAPCFMACVSVRVCQPRVAGPTDAREQIAGETSVRMSWWAVHYYIFVHVCAIGAKQKHKNKCSANFEFADLWRIISSGRRVTCLFTSWILRTKMSSAKADKYKVCIPQRWVTVQENTVMSCPWLRGCDTGKFGMCVRALHAQATSGSHSLYRARHGWQYRFCWWVGCVRSQRDWCGIKSYVAGVEKKNRWMDKKARKN